MARRLAVLLLSVVVPPAIALAWLGLRIFQQDRAMLVQRELERRQGAAQGLTRALERAMAEAERSIGTAAVPPGTVRLTAAADEFKAEPPDGVLWLPGRSPLPSPPSEPFAAAEQLEFQNQPLRASAIYEQLAQSSSDLVKAGALVRQARIHRRNHQWNEALRAYRRLAALSRVSIEGTPADLVARRAIGSILFDSGATSELRGYAVELQRDFLDGRWRLDRASWLLTERELTAWTGTSIARGEREEISIAADGLFADRHIDPDRDSGRTVVGTGGSAFSVLWKRNREQMTWLVIPRRVIEGWLRAHPAGPEASLLSGAGQLIAGRDPSLQHDVVSLAPAETRLPWTVMIGQRSDSEIATDLRGRRLALAAGLGAILLLLAGTSYVLWRVVQRDLAVVKLQTDFVATVSHEFRTPLASLRHLTELLEEGDDVPFEKRKSFYAALARNTERLQRLVESLLDFARIESGRKTYDLRPVDLGQLAGAVVADFRDTAHRHIDLAFDAQASGLQVRADVSSLGNALWNLLDNAVKYSPDGGTVAVALKSSGRHVTIEVRDSGMGIPADEQREIFRKFVRGKTARALGIKGTGLGLALVTHIVRAHGGQIDVDSEQGVGSTFRITIPSHEEPVAADTRQDLGAFRTS
jgi:signal transduction histidine kinase